MLHHRGFYERMSTLGGKAESIAKTPALLRPAGMYKICSYRST